MTNLLGIATAILVSLAPAAWAYPVQDDAPQRHTALTFNPFALFSGAFDLQIETRRSTGSALAVRADLGAWSHSDWNWGFFGVGVAWRMYPEHHALNGLYWGPGAAASFVRARIDDPFGTRLSGSGLVAGPTLEAGYQFVINGGFAADLGAGAAWYFGAVTANANGRILDAPVSGLRPYVRIALGYAWR